MSSNNPGIIKLAKKAAVMKTSDPATVADYAIQTRPEIAVVGPEAPLVNGVVDALTKQGIKCVGPSRKLARLEGDKAFCRELMSRHAIAGNPVFRIFTDLQGAESFIKTAGPVAIKPAGLTGGKGVKVSREDLPTKEDELAYAREIFRNKIGGTEKLVVEELLDGEEYSLQAFVDGQDIYVMPLVQDHKRAYENDSGPNTGGMGSYSDRNHLLPFVSQGDLDFSSRIMTDVVRALQKDTGSEYRGVLYGQFMLARGADEEKPSPKLIEFNCRFGDPEAMNVLPLLSDETSLLEICERVADGNLTPRHVLFQPKASVCKYLVPANYPERARTGEMISVDEGAIAGEGALLFYASVDLKDGQIVTTASRTIGLVAIGDTMEDAEKTVEEAMPYVKGPLRHRADIGTSRLVRKRIDHMRSLQQAPTLTRAVEAGII
jgi:phosphoribosylamine--glycine ligase